MTQTARLHSQPGPGLRELDLANLTTQVAVHLRSAILGGQLRAGEFVRPTAVAQELSLSATPVREALISLEVEGFVHRLPRRGFVVSKLSRADIEDTYFLHAIVAGELAARAAERLEAPALDRLESLQSDIHEAYQSGQEPEVESLNAKFHRLINCQARSPKLTIFVGTCLQYVPLGMGRAIPGWPEATATDHCHVLKALRAKDPAQARTAMVDHLNRARSLLIDYLIAERIVAQEQDAEDYAACDGWKDQA